MSISTEAQIIAAKRRDLVIHLRDKKNMTFKEIGIAVSTSKGNAYMLYRVGKWRQKQDEFDKSNDPFYGLSTRIRNCLKNYGFRTRQQIEAAIKDGLILMKMKNFGWKSEQELYRWLGMSPPLSQEIESKIETLYKKATQYKKQAERIESYCEILKRRGEA